jgi:hypothetical protein
MFGGAGVYADGVMFALGVRDVLYFKTAPEQKRRALRPKAARLSNTRAQVAPRRSRPIGVYRTGFMTSLPNWPNGARTALTVAGAKRRRKQPR